MTNCQHSFKMKVIFVCLIVLTNKETGEIINDVNCLIKFCIKCIVEEEKISTKKTCFY